jgi:hypothetical protein
MDQPDGILDFVPCSAAKFKNILGDFPGRWLTVSRAIPIYLDRKARTPRRKKIWPET